MAVERISVQDDPRVALFRQMTDAELMRSSGLFVAEGRLVVRRVVRDARYRVRSLLVNDAALNDLAPDLAGLPAAVPILVCQTEDLRGITGHDMHRGCLGLVERPKATAVDEILTASKTLVILEGVTNADNVGGVFRNAAALGAGGVVLSPTCCDPLYRKAIRTSMGATLRVPFARLDGWPSTLTRLRTAGFTVVALTPREPSETLDAFAARARPHKLALIVGTEGSGLTPAVEAAADYRVRIPIDADVDSLNLVSAAGIALYTLTAHS